MGPIPDAINAEIFPIHLIGTANAIGACANWIADFAISEVFGIIQGISLTAEICMYVVLAGFSVLTYFFAYYFIKETAGKPIESVLEDILGQNYQ